MKNDYDVIIVGAGPAGSICARSLGLANLSVLLIDKAHFPRDKTCGDFISARLCDRLIKSGLHNAFKKVSHAPIDDLLFSHPTIGSFHTRDALDREGTTGFVCRREDLDAVLFEEAKKYADVLEGVKIKGLLIEGGQVTGVKSEERSFRAKIVVGADGANGVIAKSLGVATFDEEHNAVAIRSYYSNIKGMTNSVELHFLDEVQPGYFWIFPVDHAAGEANVGLGILSRNVRNNNVQLKQLLNRIIKEHPQFKERFAHASCMEPTKGWSLPFGSKKRPFAFNGALLIGDAAGLIDPMSGEGIENAFRSAECASSVIQKAVAAKDYSQHFLMQYEEALERMLRAELRKGFIIQKVSRNPFLLKMIFFLLKHSRTGRRIIANKFF
ncbi:MAG: NAD(P)/FAD-dependent oxidoreductase [Candidatus Protochlamydia sp.]|nr:NAD(P)/FAD-dependent oxidoreductase [Candidatus Protochlamydia sp.]